MYHDVALSATLLAASAGGSKVIISFAIRIIVILVVVSVGAYFARKRQKSHSGNK